MADPLAAFRKKPAGATAETPPPKAPDGYIAFDAKDSVQRLKIRRANNPTRAPGYAHLLEVVYDGTFGTNFVLVYTFLMVMVRGRNLQPVIMALEMSNADFIQEFDPDKWEKPKDEKAPFIESIEIVVQDSGPSITETEKSGKERAPGRSLH
ncbi:MAG TPA: hypothetical protein VGO59_11655 [Verrucomicrobiae bacterium]|jgi:hypothetical protein